MTSARVTPPTDRVCADSSTHTCVTRSTKESMRCSAIVDIVAALVGPAVRFDHSKLNYKPRNASGAIEWHQDWAFYPYTNDDMLAVGVLIEDVTEDNGPMMVIPGSHRGPIFDHYDQGLFVGALDTGDKTFDASNAVTLAGTAGSITVHHVRTIHGSKENLTDRDRPFLVLSYVAVDAWPLTQSYELDEFNSRILRGEPTLAPPSGHPAGTYSLPQDSAHGFYLRRPGQRARTVFRGLAGFHRCSRPGGAISFALLDLESVTGYRHIGLGLVH